MTIISHRRPSSRILTANLTSRCTASLDAARSCGGKLAASWRAFTYHSSPSPLRRSCLTPSVPIHFPLVCEPTRPGGRVTRACSTRAEKSLSVDGLEVAEGESPIPVCDMYSSTAVLADSLDVAASPSSFIALRRRASVCCTSGCELPRVTVVTRASRLVSRSANLPVREPTWAKSSATCRNSSLVSSPMLTMAPHLEKGIGKAEEAAIERGLK